MQLKNLLLSTVLLAFSVSAFAQNLSLVSPEGLFEPYEVTPGTEVTVQWDYFGEIPVMFTHTEEPDLPAHQFFPNEAWTQSADVVDNGDGTFNYSLTVDEPTWIFGGFQTFSGWAYSNVIAVSIASPVVIEYEDGLVCNDGTGVEILSAVGTYDSYQWYMNDVEIDGATSMTYEATEAGSYKLQAPFDGEMIFSNTLVVTNPVIDLSGDFTQGETSLTINATDGFDSYQWLSGPSESDLSPLDGQTAASLSVELLEEIVYYSVEGTIDGCTVSTAAQPASLGAFETPVLTLAADSNSFGNVCDGTTINIIAPENYGTYSWTKDGFEAFGDQALFSISQTWQEGSYAVHVSPVGWPEITLSSEAVDATYFVVDSPQLIVDEFGPYCPGQEINVVLGDEGYDYTWYMHTDFNYTDEDIIEVDGTTLTFNFSEQVRVSVEASFEGCTSSTTQNFNSAADQSPFISFIDWNEQYLCTDSISEIQVPSWSAGNFENFQWYKDEDGTEVILEGETELIYGASEEGFYFVKADLIACPGVNVSSTPIEVESYLDRDLFIWGTSETICEGDTATLNVSGNQWQDIQWFDKDIQIGDGGYEEFYTPMIGAGDTTFQDVTEYSGYLVKARHTSCPTGLKIESNIIEIRPTINPNVVVDPDYGVNDWFVHNWDSVPSYLYCTGEPVELSLDDESGDYEWYTSLYGGADDYELGTLIEESQNTSVTAIADGVSYYTARVEIDGCVGYSDPVLIDTYVFSPPAITSYGNGELCGEGDSVLIHNSFPGNYAGFQWFNNGIPVEGATDDSLWVTVPGFYTLTVWREECPEFGLNTGLGPNITLMDAFILEEDDLIWASTGAFGSYTYQWYFNGEPIESPADTPWLLNKDEMEDGVYYCEVTNPDGCTKVTDEFVWSTLGVYSIADFELKIFPNPMNDYFIFEGIDVELVQTVTLFDLSGKQVLQVNPMSERVNTSSLPKGIYFIELRLKDGNKLSHKLAKG